eukprot:jgi/Mesvir1/14268/Mv09699-RA.1
MLTAPCRRSGVPHVTMSADLGHASSSTLGKTTAGIVVEASSGGAPLLPKNCELPPSHLLPSSLSSADDRKPGHARGGSPSPECADENENRPPSTCDDSPSTSSNSGVATGGVRSSTHCYRAQNTINHNAAVPAALTSRETTVAPERHPPHQAQPGAHGMSFPEASAVPSESPRVAGISRRSRRGGGDVASSGGAPSVRRSVAESDLELARALQEQENAYYALSLQRSVSQPLPPARHGRTHSSPLELQGVHLAAGLHAGIGHAGSARQEGRASLRRSGLRPNGMAEEGGPPPLSADEGASGHGDGMSTRDTDSGAAALAYDGPLEGGSMARGGVAAREGEVGEPSGDVEGGETSVGDLACRGHQYHIWQNECEDGALDPAAQLYGDALRQGIPLPAHHDHSDGDGDEGEGEYSDEEAEEVLNPDRMTYEELIFLGEVVGVQSRGASSQRIASLVKRELGKEEAERRSEEQCAICRMEFEAGDGLARLPCVHEYHTPCIEQWLGINKACPVCFKELEEPAV